MTLSVIVDVVIGAPTGWLMFTGRRKFVMRFSLIVTVPDCTVKA